MSVTPVLVDATALGEAAATRGVGTYVRGVLAGLGGRDDLAVRALVRDSTHAPVGVGPVVVRRQAPGRWRHLEQELRASADLRHHRGDAVVHGLDTEPPFRPPRPYVQTLFDVIPLVVDDPALAARRRRWQRLAPRFRAAERVIAISRHAADTGIAHLGLDSRRVVVTPLGVDTAFSPDGARHTEDDGAPYVLLVGEYAERKGYRAAFDVVGRLAERGLPHRLLVAGAVAPWKAATVESVVARAPRPDRVRIAGWVDDLPSLYRGADAVVVTSRYEGFGLPAAEAMACGTPVVAFANTSLVEVVGPGGVLVDDGDTGAFADATARLLIDASARADVVAAGFEHVAAFTWERCAAVHADVYHAVAERR